MKNPSLFLSYSRRDSTWVDPFADALREASFDVCRATDVPSGRKWDSWLRNAINEADAVVAVLSEASAQNPELLFEVGAADASGKPIVSIVLGHRPPKLPLIRPRDSLTATSPKDTARRLVASLAAHETRA